jgi:hypothetical protein
MESFEQYEKSLSESAQTSRYSVDVNYRTSIEETLSAFAKITLGYVSAALKNAELHCKQVYDAHPIRLLVSGRNWDDGEWICVVAWNPKLVGFTISKGFFNKDRKTVTVQSTHKCSGSTAADIVKEVRNIMHKLKGEKDRTKEKLKPVPLKRGPK